MESGAGDLLHPRIIEEYEQEQRGVQRASRAPAYRNHPSSPREHPLEPLTGRQGTERIIGRPPGSLGKSAQAQDTELRSRARNPIG